MRSVRLLIAGSTCLAVQVSAMPPHNSLDNPAYSQPAERWEVVEDAGPVGVDVSMPDVLTSDALRQLEDLRSASCRDTINKAREEAGKPPLLNREPASPNKPLAIYAVDRRQDGCSVMVMMGDREDIRQLPLPAEGPLHVIPAEVGR